MRLPPHPLLTLLAHLRLQTPQIYLTLPRRPQDPRLCRLPPSLIEGEILLTGCLHGLCLEIVALHAGF
jgi:hypothetical protein